MQVQYQNNIQTTEEEFRYASKWEEFNKEIFKPRNITKELYLFVKTKIQECEDILDNMRDDDVEKYFAINYYNMMIKTLKDGYGKAIKNKVNYYNRKTGIEVKTTGYDTEKSYQYRTEWVYWMTEFNYIQSKNYK
jgi:hypothetical protein